MDPLSAVSLASSILTFIDISSKLVSRGREIHHSSTGSLPIHEEIKSANERITQLSQHLIGRYTGSPSHFTKDEQAIEKLSSKCVETASELNNVLNELSARPDQRFTSVRKAIGSVWKEKKICEMEKRLKRYSSELHSHLTAALTDGQSLVLSSIEELARVLRDLKTDNKNDLFATHQSLLDAIDRSQKSKHSEMLESAELRARMNDLIQESNTFALQKRMLKALRFAKMRSRQRNVHVNHQGTFDWIFHREHASLCLMFADWLEKENGVFWITGKAGSGKSTFMKFVCEHERTKDKLRQWAGGKKLVTGSFFFWNAGNDLEKSQEGLLRSLIFEILRQCPKLITNVRSKYLEDPWRSELEEASFTIDELTNIFKQLTALPGDQLRFCFFIDGLDEYSGQPRVIAQLLEKFATIPNVKLCLSSRPWTAFEDIFGQFDRFKLVIDHYTVDDIKHYVNEILGSDRTFIRLKSKDLRYETLVTEIVVKAKGVFLWVYLVVAELCNNLSNNDMFEEFQQRVRDFPDDLEPYFMHILNSIPKKYRQSSSKALLACLEADAPLDLLTLVFILDQQCDSLSMPIEPMTEKALKEMSQNGRTRLKARCLDLLEVVNYDEGDGEMEEPQYADPAFYSRSDQHSWVSRYTVDVLHRTVYDFLRQQEILELIRSRVLEPFEPCEAICGAKLAQLKVLPLQGHNLHGAADLLLKDLLFYLQRRSEQVEISDKAFPIETERVSIELAERSPHIYFPLANSMLHPMPSVHGSPVLQLACCLGYTNFLSQRLEEDPSLSKDIYGKPPLQLVLLEYPITRTGLWNTHVIDADVVDLLLHYGADPMEVFRGYPIWVSLLYRIRISDFPEHSLSATHMFKIVGSLLRAGASLDYELEIGKGDMLRSSGQDIARHNPEKKNDIVGALTILKRCFGTDQIDQFISIAREQKNQRQSILTRWLTWLPGA